MGCRISLIFSNTQLRIKQRRGKAKKHRGEQVHKKGTEEKEGKGKLKRTGKKTKKKKKAKEKDSKDALATQIRERKTKGGTKGKDGERWERTMQHHATLYKASTIPSPIS